MSIVWVEVLFGKVFFDSGLCCCSGILLIVECANWFCEIRQKEKKGVAPLSVLSHSSHYSD